MTYTPLTSKKRQLDRSRPLPAELVRNLDEWFRVELTYTSNAIEGNTLTRRETAVVLDKGITIGGRSLKEHLEATNHAHALDWIHTFVDKRPKKLSQHDILAIHAMILRGIDDANAGRYRNVPVRIAGSLVVLPNPRKVSALMDDFAAWLSHRNSLHPIAFASEAHYRLVTIHPFVDGNGRTARLLMNLLLLQRGYPPAIIQPRDRLAYIEALETAQLGGARDAFDALIAQAVDRSLDLYLRAARGESAQPNAEATVDTLLKIGALATAAGVTVPTIRFWVQQGLLTVAEVTTSGYQLFAPAMVQRCRQIQQLKSERLTLAEIKVRLSSPLSPCLCPQTGLEPAQVQD